MAEFHASNIFGYGTPGSANYDSKRRIWSFLRPLVPDLPQNEGSNGQLELTAFPLRAINQNPQTSVQASRRLSEELISKSESRIDFDDLKKTVPGLISNSSFVVEDVRSSKNCVSHPRSQDPIYSNLLAFGNAIITQENFQERRRYVVPIAAQAYGKSGELLRLVRLGKDSVEVRSDEGEIFEIEVPSVGDDDEAWWSGAGGPIYQIRFAESPRNKATWMAVRQASCTTFFRPTVHRIERSSRHADTRMDYQTYAVSALDANPVVTLPVSKTGGQHHVDVDFDPMNDQRVVIADTSGTWSVWTIERKNRKSARIIDQIRLQIHGNLHMENKAEPDNAPLHFDGWHAIKWLADGEGNVDRILFCNRRRVALFSAINGHLLAFPGLDLGPLRQRHWILDVRRSSMCHQQCFVLTSEQLIWFSTAIPEWTMLGRNASDLHAVLSWRHFMNSEDKTLYLTIVESSLDTIVLISSRLTDLTKVFRFGKLNDKPSALSLADPIPLFLMPPNHQNESFGNVLLPCEQHFFRVDYRIQKSPEVHRNNLECYKLFALNPDLSLSEQLFQRIPALDLSDLNKPSPIILPLPRMSPKRSSRYADITDLDDFLIEHDEDSKFVEDDFLLVLRQERRFNKSLKPVDVPQDRRVDNVDLRAIADGSSTLTQTSHFPEQPKSFARHLGLLRSRCQSVLSSQNPGLRTLRELIPTVPRLNDVEEESKQLSDLTTGLSTSQEPKHQDTLRIFNLSPPTIPETYDSFISNYIIPLPLSTPNSLRNLKERTCRQVTAELILSHLTIHPRPLSPPGPTPPPSPSRHSPPPSSSSLPLSSIPARLSPYTSLNLRSTNLQTSTNQSSASSILAHLPPNDALPPPSSYSYTLTNSRLLAEHQAQAEPQDQDPAFIRRAERARKRLEKAAAVLARRKAETQPIISSRVPGVMSSQARAANDPGSSSQMTGGIEEGVGLGVAQSQPISGAHAIRVNAKKPVVKKKTRKPGF
ncbi:MAG: hypothetical protein Q9227_007040 [Pyrenula ochraceoflavens]